MTGLQNFRYRANFLCVPIAAGTIKNSGVCFVDISGGLGRLSHGIIECGFVGCDENWRVILLFDGAHEQDWILIVVTCYGWARV